MMGHDVRINTMRELINHAVLLNMTMNKIIANSKYFKSDMMNQISSAINNLDKAVYLLDEYMEELKNNGME